MDQETRLKLNDLIASYQLKVRSCETLIERSNELGLVLSSQFAQERKALFNEVLNDLINLDA